MAMKYVFYKREKKFRKTFEKMEGFSFVTPVTGLNRPNTGKEDDDDEICILSQKICRNYRQQKCVFETATRYPYIRPEKFRQKD
jgi:hypothetical protein